jgi:DMSO/TMAO reductase YedYZ molybdopterin-dependent catalytic subunit
MRSLRPAAAAIAVLLCIAPRGAHAQEKPAATLTIAGDVATPLKLTAADLKSMPRVTVQIQENGQTTSYEGVRVVDILTKAGVPSGTELRGGALSTYVVAKASDGYQVVFSLGELDPALTGNEIIVADTVDGKPLTATLGPLRVVIPKDTRGARSIRMLERIDVVRLKK